ncbi:MAG: asparagine synthase-related protein [Pseudomonadota bacterium]
MKSLLKISNIFWLDGQFAPLLDGEDPERLKQDLSGVKGQFSLALERKDGSVVLIRDKHGINKLFFGIGKDGELWVANYVIDLVSAGIAFESIYSVPSGHFVEIDSAAQSLKLTRYYSPTMAVESEASLEQQAVQIRAALEQWFERLSERFRDHQVCLCLSGGLDSSLIAALAVKYFPSVSAFTYSFVSPGHAESEDAIYARRIAEHLKIPFNFIPATREDILSALDRALVYGQDWRDFNLHCAIVNEFLARHMAAWRKKDPARGKVLVLTGDMMNEIVADYSPITYKGQEYYSLPDLDFDKLRLVLVKGLDTGDREVGVFARHGIDLVQVYGLVVDEYLKVPSAEIEEPGAKNKLVRAIASDLLPDFLFNRQKVRAQIGTSDEPTGILPCLVDAGYTSDVLAEAWKKKFSIESDNVLRQFIRAGFYRVATKYPK